MLLNKVSKILDNLYLTNMKGAQNIDEIKKNGIKHILNISFKPNYLKDNETLSLSYTNLRVEDLYYSNLIESFEEFYELIEKTRNENNGILVHCQAGCSRSATVVLAYLMKKNNLTKQEALDYVRSIRPLVGPNHSFFQQLEMWFQMDYMLDTKGNDTNSQQFLFLIQIDQINKQLKEIKEEYEKKTEKDPNVIFGSLSKIVQICTNPILGLISEYQKDKLITLFDNQDPRFLEAMNNFEKSFIEIGLFKNSNLYRENDFIKNTIPNFLKLIEN
ncbi:dual specificity protein phosphatase [Anaeramoeba flamelloides]|uniref:protein-tyrosine-phosphatase n=1 Tax=Anaeramoeba flamelloides TaxID=1746091 RepID=A0ABQ8YND9_9EUKA|nr:dual specificity protein phosphatase [Anaeramoeba flamelloides]